jgi:hypothetical protein
VLSLPASQPAPLTHLQLLMNGALDGISSGGGTSGSTGS